MIPINSLIYKKDIIISNKINIYIEIKNDCKSNRIIPYGYILNYQTPLFKNSIRKDI